MTTGIGSKRFSPPLEVWVAIIGYCIYVAMVFMGPRDEIHDEGWYLNTARDLQQQGMTVDYLRNYPGPAGPLYAVTQTLASPLTGLHAPGTRLVNCVLFAALVALLAALSRARATPWNGFDLLGSPFIVLPMGVALTEMPALTCLMLSILFLFRCLDLPEDKIGLRVLLAIVGGFCLGAAIFGRQTLLLLLIGLPVLLNRKNFWYLALYALTAVVFIMPTFIIWGGLVAPLSARVEQGMKLDHFLKAFAYIGIISAFIAPRFLRVPVWTVIPMALMALFFRYGLGIPSMYGFVQNVSSRHLPDWVALRAADGFSLFYGFMACLTLVACARAVWSNREDRRYLFIITIAILMVASCAKITHIFSTRYVFVSFPLWILVFLPYRDTGFFKAGRFTLAVILGVITMSRYYHAGSSVGAYQVADFKLNPPVQIFTDDSNATGNAYVSTKPDVAVNDPDTLTQPSVVYPFRQKKTDTYSVWLLCRANDARSDTFYYAIDPAPGAAYTEVTCDPKNYGQWAWVRLAVTEIAAGKHTLALKYRSPGCKWNQIIIDKADYIPVGEY